MQLQLTDFLSIIEIAGVDASQFLQSQLTQDLHARNPYQLQWQAYCSRDGLVQSIFGLWEKEEKFYLLLPKELRDNTFALLKKYGAFAKITLQLISSPPIFLQIEKTDEVNWTWDIGPSPTSDDTPLYFSWRTRFIEIPSISSYDQLRDLFIQHAFPWLNAESAGKFRPHDLNFIALNLVSFKKGCFPGQEIIARTQYRGKPKSAFHAYRLNGLHTFNRGAHLMNNDRIVGTITDVIYGNDFTDLSCILQNDEHMQDVEHEFPL